MRLTEVQRTVLTKLAAGAELRWEDGIGLLVGEDRVRSRTVCALTEAGLVKVQPYAPDADRIDYTITEAGYEALGIKLESAGPGATGGMVALEEPFAGEKPIMACLYVLGLGLIDLPEMAAEDQANLLAIIRKRVPDFGRRVEFLESGIVDLGNQVVLLLSSPDEPVYLAIFCEDMATALAIVTVYAREGDMELVQARRFDPLGHESPLDLGEAL